MIQSLLVRMGCVAGMLAAMSGCVSVPAGPAGPRPEVGSAAMAAMGEEKEEQGAGGGERGDLGPPPPGYWRIIGHPAPDWGQGGVQKGPLDWKPVGPRPIGNEYWSGKADASGRVVSIATHPTDPNTAYIASASGGVWKTTDAGTNWMPLTDGLPILNHGVVAIDRTDPQTVYAGTGEYTTGSTGDGIFRSRDGGQTWDRAATAAQVGSSCSGLAVDPGNPLVIHHTSGKGYTRSIDGGATWVTTLSGDMSALAVNPVDPAIVYVGRWAGGVYRSIDRGLTFTKLSGGLPGSGFSRIVLSISPSQPGVVYAALADNNSGLLGLYKTMDGGDTWVKKTKTPNFPYPQSWYDMFVGVAPNSPDVVYAGGVSPAYAYAGVVKTGDGGETWKDVTKGAQGGQVHPDQHCCAFGADGAVWVGCDGGVWRSFNGGSKWLDLNGTLAVTQQYAIALHPSDANRILGGTQDNGTAGRMADELRWPQVTAGDGGFTAYDFDTPTRYYTTYVYLTVFRINGNQTADITGPWGNDPANFIAPLVMDPNNSRTLLGGTNRVWRTANADGAATWTAISGTDVAGGSALAVIAVAPGHPDTIYTGSNNGRVYTTTDANMWTNRSAGLSSGQISDVVIDPADPRHVFVSQARSVGYRVYETTDAGANWVQATGDLPAGAPVTALAVDWTASPPGLYAGSGAGIYTSDDGGAHWTHNGPELPNVNIGDLAIDPARRTITAGTYGRGAWRADLAPACYPDFDGNGTLDLFDFLAYVNTFNAGDAKADYTKDGSLDLFDFLCFVNAFNAGC